MKKFKIEYIDPKKLKPYKLNAKTHPQSQLDLLAHSIVNFEPDVPIVCDENYEIIKGHGRHMVFLQRNYDLCPVIIRDDLSKTEKRAARLADNRSAESPLDTEILKLELDELKLDFELADIGFDEGYLDGLGLNFSSGENDSGGTSDPPSPVISPEILEKWNVKPGQTWNIGRHKLICGDCNDEAVISDIKPDVIFTDPPYGIKMDKGLGGSARFGGTGKKRISRKKYKGGWDSDRPTKKLFDRLISMSNRCFFFGGNYFSDILPPGMHWLVWDKLNTAPKMSDCELVFTTINRKSVKKYTVEYNGLIGKESERYHPTQKPVKICELILGDYTEPDEVIFDPFLGSGTTLIACEKLGRTCHGIEINPEYCAVVLERFFVLTGEIAKPG